MNDVTKKFNPEMKMLAKEVDSKSTVSFNYPKYEAKGTPHEVWLENVNLVERFLESILKAQPFKDEYPLMHLRREEQDDSGRVIRVHLDVFGKGTLVKLTLAFLSEAEKVYVENNLLASPQAKEHLNQIVQNGQGMIIPITDPSKAKEQVEKFLKAQGMDPKKVKVVYSGLPPEFQNANPLNLDGLDDQNGEDVDLNLGPLLMGNPDPEDYN